MVTFTLRHAQGMALAMLLTGMAKAWRRTRQGGAVQRLWRKYVSASVRAFEVTWSYDNGWHPHIHVMLRSNEWTDDEKETLAERWRLAVVRELGEACEPDDEHGVHWSESFDLCKGGELGDVEHAKTRYMFKLGLEIAGDAKRPAKRSVTPWQLAEHATRGSAKGRELWLEYARATRGKRMIELDDRMQRFAKTPRPDLDMTSNVDSTIQRVMVPVDAIELAGLRWYERTRDPAILAQVLADVAASQEPKPVLKTWLEVIMGRVRYARTDAQASQSRATSGAASPEIPYLDTG